MSRPSVARVAAEGIPLRRARKRLVVAGIPNSGKSTLFNRLTGLRQRTGNFPGVTVERHEGSVSIDGEQFELIDLPGLFALSAHSIEERIAADVILGKMPDAEPPAGIVAVVDATHLYQGLFLLQQLMEMQLPVIVALTMTDAAQLRGLKIDVSALSIALGGVTVCPVVATTGEGVQELRNAIAGIGNVAAAEPVDAWPEMQAACAELARNMDESPSLFELIRTMAGDSDRLPMDDELAAALREQVFAGDPPLAVEARKRYAWARRTLTEVTGTVAPVRTIASRFAAFMNRPVPGTIGLFAVMAIVFQAVFAWATPLMDAIDGSAAGLGAWANSALGGGVLASFVADGVIAGVGSVVVFLPQIVILFLFIIVLEDSGYLARAAYLMDRLMRSVGLSGQSIIPMISSFACAVPGIMASRVIPNRRDRIATILAAPFMTCSARLPVYALLIAAFVPQRDIGIFNLQGIALFGLYLLGIVAGLLTALALKRSALKGPKPAFALMLPEFRRPNIQTVLMQLLGRVKVFLKRAGTVIFLVAVIVWVLAYFPRSEDIQADFALQQSVLDERLAGDELLAASEDLANLEAAAQLEQSFLGRAGKLIEPVFRPLGWDWKVSAAVIASFPAREVVVAVLGTTFAVGDEADEVTLTDRLTNATHSDGRPLFTLPMVIGLMIFYALCLQCAATIAVIRRETNSWRWPAFAWAYMTTLGYLGALIAYQLF